MRSGGAIHSLCREVAMEVGSDAAIIFFNIEFWCEKNEVNGFNFFDGRYWTYNSSRAFANQFPYMKPRYILKMLEKLESVGLIISGHYGSNKFDRTKWYSIDYNVLDAIIQKNNSHSHKTTLRVENRDTSHSHKTTHGDVENGRCYTDINTDIETNINTDIRGFFTASPKKEKKAKEPFVPPTEKESVDYFVENGFSEKAAKEAFAYYTRMEWKDRNGSAVKNWKQKYKSVWFKDENKALPKHKDEGLKGFDPKYAFDPKYRPTYSASGDQVIYQRRFGV